MRDLWAAIWQFELTKGQNGYSFDMGCGYIYVVILLLGIALLLI